MAYRRVALIDLYTYRPNFIQIKTFCGRTDYVHAVAYLECAKGGGPGGLGDGSPPVGSRGKAPV